MYFQAFNLPAFRSPADPVAADKAALDSAQILHGGAQLRTGASVRNVVQTGQNEDDARRSGGAEANRDTAAFMALMAKILEKPLSSSSSKVHPPALPAPEPA